MPFAALRGYYELIRQRERQTEPRRELPQERAELLSRKMSRVHKGSMVKITYYDKDAYQTAEGVVTAFEPVYRWITIVKTKIPLDDVWDISGEGIPEEDED